LLTFFPHTRLHSLILSYSSLGDEVVASVVYRGRDADAQLRAGGRDWHLRSRSGLGKDTPFLSLAPRVLHSEAFTQYVYRVRRLHSRFAQ
jgi:hypothetical protein